VSRVRWNIYEALCQGAVLTGATELQHGALSLSTSYKWEPPIQWTDKLFVSCVWERDHTSRHVWMYVIAKVWESLCWIVKWGC
jgi:hypothetical protein